MYRMPRSTQPAVLRIGVLTPHATPGPEIEFAAMAPGRLVARVARVTTAANDAGEPASSSDLRTLTSPECLDSAAETLLVDTIDGIGHASTTSGYVIGFDAETAMVSRLAESTGLPVAATCSSAVHALRVLDVERVALVGAPWFAREYNELGTAYFASQGFRVVSSQSAGLSQHPRDIEHTGVRDWTSQHVDDDAEAVFIGGNGFRAARAIDELEAALGRPVLTSNQVLLWQLLARADATFPIDGYGRLFARKPPSP
jgi:maleate isomerase